MTMTTLEAPARDVWLAMKRGLMGHCPHCGEGRIFSSYLKVNPTCPHCGEELHHHRADDAPPYITVFIVGHIVVGLMLTAEQFYDDSPIWLNVLIWPLLAVVLSLLILPRVKGALIAYQWALRMHGFDKNEGGEAHD